MVANLQQNPARRPIASVWLPALLKAGCMWLIAGEKTSEDQPAGAQGALPGPAPVEERWLLPKDTWLVNA